MDSGSLDDMLCRVATHLYEQGNRDALRLLLLTDAGFQDECIYLNDDGYDVVEPATFVLYGPQEVFESYRRGSAEFSQIVAAFGATYRRDHYVRVVEAEPINDGAHWQEILANRLPSAFDIP